jgi:hypothetical protein
MTSEQKIIRAKVGLLELAKQLGNVSQACKLMGYSRLRPCHFSRFFSWQPHLFRRARPQRPAIRLRLFRG